MNARMRAMVLHERGGALREVERPLPDPGPGQVQIEVEACGVCRTDLHLVDGELPDIRRYPIVPGHEIVGRVEQVGTGVASAGVAARRSASASPGWAGPAASARYCRGGRENLCDEARFTGYQIDGGYADVRPGRRPLLLPVCPQSGDAAEPGAPALRRADRLPRAGAWPADRRSRDSASTASAPPPTSSAQVAVGRGASLRLHPCGRCATPGVRARPRAPSGPAMRTQRPRTPLDAAHHLRPGRRAGAGSAARRAQGRHGGLRRHPHERHPGLSLRRSSGASAASSRWPTSPAATARSSSRWRRGFRSGPRSPAFPWPRPTRPSPLLRSGQLQGAAVLAAMKSFNIHASGYGILHANPPPGGSASGRTSMSVHLQTARGTDGTGRSVAGRTRHRAMNWSSASIPT